MANYKNHQNDYLFILIKPFIEFSVFQYQDFLVDDGVYFQLPLQINLNKRAPISTVIISCVVLIG
jgi:hypothetical protein